MVDNQLTLILYIPYREYLTYGTFLKTTIYKEKFSLIWNYSTQSWSSPTTTITHIENPDNSRTHTITTTNQTLIDTLKQFIKLAKLPTTPPPLPTLHILPTIPLQTLIDQTIAREQTLYPSIHISTLTYLITSRLTDANKHLIHNSQL
ncbi:hypothetical protein KAT92_06385 [Candidatus Babeliales bacterium]|nr:hypothetical protein [Candidatus Babeliales bacterium]